MTSFFNNNATPEEQKINDLQQCLTDEPFKTLLLHMKTDLEISYNEATVLLQKRYDHITSEQATAMKLVSGT